MTHFKLTSDFATDAGSTRSHSDLQAQTPPDAKHGKTRDPTNLPSHPIATVRPAHGTRSSYVSRAVLANWRKVQEIHGICKCIAVGTVPLVLVPVHQSWDITPTDLGALSIESTGIGEMSRSVER
ncbi:hypothetical protein CEP51_012636 [Fusarium floridanum]|uniref:Uncharacterized protein n=1 Tax=Fusarium floridanum TaxID=1325733 RepID=A0A428QQT5_9HYPO|nr:hypothetical protein CEP51_012636 [Fusarium floridanum]